MDVNIGTNIKIIEIPVNEFNEAYLPNNCVAANKILIGDGDNLYGLAKVNNLNPIPQVDATGVRTKRLASEPTGDHPTGAFPTGIFPFVHMTQSGEYAGRFFGVQTQQPFAYQDFGYKIQLDARLDVDCVYVIYTTRGVHLSDNNLIHPWAEDAVKCYMDWKYVDAKKGIWENQNERRHYHIEKRNAYGRIQGLGFEEYMEIVRSYNSATYKG
jgi:hypothetical protein